MVATELRRHTGDLGELGLDTNLVIVPEISQTQIIQNLNMPNKSVLEASELAYQADIQGLTLVTKIGTKPEFEAFLNQSFDTLPPVVWFDNGALGSKLTEIINETDQLERAGMILVELPLTSAPYDLSSVKASLDELREVGLLERTLIVANGANSYDLAEQVMKDYGIGLVGKIATEEDQLGNLTFPDIEGVLSEDNPSLRFEELTGVLRVKKEKGQIHGIVTDYQQAFFVPNPRLLA